VTEEDAELLAEALQHIDQWSRAYPVTVFPEPDLKRAHELLTAGGMTLDAISADAMRHVVLGVGRIARDALQLVEPAKPGSGLRQLAEKIERVARMHPEFSRCYEIIRVCCDHLCAIERISELNRLQHGG